LTIDGGGPKGKKSEEEVEEEEDEDEEEEEEEKGEAVMKGKQSTGIQTEGENTEKDGINTGKNGQRRTAAGVQTNGGHNRRGGLLMVKVNEGHLLTYILVLIFPLLLIIAICSVCHWPQLIIMFVAHPFLAILPIFVPSSPNGPFLCPPFLAFPFSMGDDQRQLASERLKRRRRRTAFIIMKTANWSGDEASHVNQCWWPIESQPEEDDRVQ
jgi:hypothetical protein